MTGVVYLLYFLTAIVGSLLPPGIGGPNTVSNDAATLANSIIGNKHSYELAVSLGLVSTVLYVALTPLFFVMLRPVGRTVALVAAACQLTGCAVTAFQSVFQVGPLLVLGGDSYLSVFDTRQLQSLALLFLQLDARTGYVALAFFGVFQILTGFLIFRSTFLPRILGILMAAAGAGWLTFLWLPLATAILTPIEVLGVLGEGPLMLWLVVMGVNGQRWQEMEATA